MTPEEHARMLIAELNGFTGDLYDATFYHQDGEEIVIKAIRDAENAAYERAAAECVNHTVICDHAERQVGVILSGRIRALKHPE